jgi:hypothetical protein
MASEQETQLKEYLANLVFDCLEEAGVEIRGSAAELIEFAAQRAERLAPHLGEPDYDEMVKAVRDVVLLEAGIRATRQADAVTRRLMKIIARGLRLLAAALAEN